MKHLPRLLIAIACLLSTRFSLAEATPAACPELNEIRRIYAEGKIEDAFLGLLCRRSLNPRDIDTLRLLSDTHWWQLDEESSRQVATDALALISQSEEPFKDEETFFHLSDRANRSSVRIEGERIDSEHTSGTDLRAIVRTRLAPRSTTRLRYNQETRVFTGSDRQINPSIALGHTQTFAGGFYIDGEIQYAQNPTFLPETHVWLSPHWTQGDADLSLLIGNRRFKDSHDVTEARATWLQHFAGGWMGAVSAQNVFTRGQLFSATASLEYRPNPRLAFRIDASGGRGLEDVNLDSPFRFAGSQFRYRFSPRWAGLIRVSRFESDVREETRAGLGAELGF